MPRIGWRGRRGLWPATGEGRASVRAATRKRTAARRRAASWPRLEARQWRIVVADNDERRAPVADLCFDVDAHGHAGIAPDDPHRGDRHRGPLAMTALPERFTLLHDIGIDANRRIVDEDAIVHRADVDRPDVPGGDHGDSLTQVERDVKNVFAK